MTLGNMRANGMRFARNDICFLLSLDERSLSNALHLMLKGGVSPRLLTETFFGRPTYIVVWIAWQALSKRKGL